MNVCKVSLNITDKWPFQDHLSNTVLLTQKSFILEDLNSNNAVSPSVNIKNYVSIYA